MTLEIWETPFARERWPSVLLIPESHGCATATVVVSPAGVDSYPKYLVRFTAVYAFAAEEEAGGLGVYDGSVHRYPPEPGCAYVWRDSPQAAEYARLFPDVACRGGRGPLIHYLLFGSDDNVGVVSAEPPAVERVDGPRSLVVTHRI